MFGFFPPPRAQRRFVFVARQTRLTTVYLEPAATHSLSAFDSGGLEKTPPSQAHVPTGPMTPHQPY